MAERVRRPHPFRSETPRANAVRTVSVRAIRELAPRLLRVTFGGAQLGAFRDEDGEHPAVVSDGFDDVAVLFFPDAHGEIARPVAYPDGRLTPDADGRVLPREYTIRGVGDGTVDVELVLHEHGVATDWARRASAGDEIVMVAPRVSRGLPHSENFIAIGDATALPALSRLAEIAPGYASLILSIPDDLHAPAPAGAHLIAEDTDAVCAVLEPDPTADTTFWIAGESSFATGVRRHLVHTCGIDRRRVQFTGYWRRDASGLLEH